MQRFIPVRRLGARLLLTTTLAALPALAGAQTTQPTVLDPITLQARAPGYVVRATPAGTKTAVPLKETPASVSVVGEQQMRDQAVGSVAQALRYTPGIASEYRGASNMSDETYIRGFGYVPRYLEGLTIGGQGQQVDPWLLGSVAAVKGPASLLYGQSNPGGLVDMELKKAEGTEVSRVGIDTGTHARAGLRWDVARRAGPDLSWRLVGLAEQADTQEQGLKTRRLTLAPSVQWKPTEATTLTAYAIYQREPDAGYRNFRTRLGTLDATRYGYVPADFLVGNPDFERSERTAHALGYTLEHKLSPNATLRQKARLSDGDWYQRTLVWDAIAPDERTISRSVTEAYTKTEQAAIDNQIEYRLSYGGADHVILGGIDIAYTRSDSQSSYGLQANPIDWRNPDHDTLILTGDPAGVSDGLSRTRQTGIYLQDQATYGALHVQAGLRYDWATNDNLNRLSGTRTTFDSEALSGRLGLLYEMANGFSPYVSYSTSFEPVTTVPATGQDPFDPTEGKQFELGVKWANPTDTLMITASAYDLRQTNVLKYDDRTATTRQVGEIRSRGFELEAQGQVTAQLSLVAGYAYNDSRISKSPVSGEVGTHNDRVPRHQASVWAKYDFANGWDAALGLRYIGKSWARGNAFTVPGVTLVDAAVGYDLGRLDTRYEGARVQLNVTNLGDEFYTASCASAVACFVGSERQARLSIDYSW